MRTRHAERTIDKRWHLLKLAGLYVLGALLLAFGIAVLGGR